MPDFINGPPAGLLECGVLTDSAGHPIPKQEIVMIGWNGDTCASCNGMRCTVCTRDQTRNN